MTATGSSLIALQKQSCARERSIYMYGELLILAELLAIRHTHPNSVIKITYFVQGG